MAVSTTLERIFQHPALVERPPVLIDIGASGEIHRKFRPIAKYAVCIAFDADLREMGHVEREGSGYRKLYVFPKICSDTGEPQRDFYLTRSPFCSSMLRPDEHSLADYVFADLFTVERVTALECIDLATALQTVGLDYVDWYKSDSQGIDLRLFRSLPEHIRRGVIMAEFEPGIFDAYQSEDKLYSVMEYMDKHGFWLSGIDLRGTQRLSQRALTSVFSRLEQKLIHVYLKRSVCWAEVSYLNSFRDTGSDVRQHLLGWVFATLQGQHGYAYDLAERSTKLFDDPVFSELRNASLNLMRSNRWRIPGVIARILFRKLRAAVGV